MITNGPDGPKDWGTVLAERLAARIEATTRVQPVSEPTDIERIEQEMSALAAAPAVSTGRGLYNAGVAQVQIDQDGVPVNDPPSSAAELLARWRARPDLYSAAACGPAYDRFVLALDDDGWAWLKEVAGETRRSARQRRMDARMDAMGVPGGPPSPVHYREPDGAPIVLAEVAPQAPVRVVSLPVTDDAEDFHEMTMAALGTPPKAARWLVWRWPAGWRIRSGAIAPGVRVLDAQPADGAVVRVNGMRMAVGNFARPFAPPPDWLVTALGGKPDRRAA